MFLVGFMLGNVNSVVSPKKFGGFRLGGHFPKWPTPKIL